MAEQLFTNEIDAAQAKRDNATSDARDQAAEFDSFVTTGIYTTPTGAKFPIHNLGTLDDDQQEAFNELQHKFQKCDKMPEAEIPERRVTAKDPDGTEVITDYPARTVRGEGFVQPYQIGGDLVKPSYGVQLATALLGEEEYLAFKAAGGKASVYSQAVMKQANALEKREADDPKSDAGTSALADLPD